jgi:heme-degrading monooxygenase HmoA
MFYHDRTSFIVPTLLLMQNFLSTRAFTSSLVALPRLVTKSSQRVHNSPLQLSMTMTTTISDAINEDISTANDKTPIIPRDRYVATNRFTVRKGKEAKFEQRWATRKSRLATLEGFRYFHLMRRVQLGGDNGTQSDTADETATFGNYVSLTVWSEKKHFTAWRKGEAFKEAHGGTSIGAFLSTLLNSALLLKDPPRPAFYDGILTQSTKPETIPETTPEGWRAITMGSNSLDLLPAECFVACNQFYIPNQNREAFEKRWADRESKLQEHKGFQAFIMLRRDASQKGHGTVEMKETEPTYVSTTIWKDRDSFNAWRTSKSFKEAHQGGKSQDSAPATPATKMQPLWVKPPSPIFYEGTLVITQSDGV